MKKQSYILFILVALAVSSITSCKKNEHKDYSTLIKHSPTVNITGVPSAIVVREDTAGVIINLTVSLSEAQSVDVHIPITQIDGDATLGDDYKLSTEEIVFPAYNNTPQQLTVTILDDDLPESDETIKLQVGDDKVANAAITPAVMNVTITNSTLPDLDMSFNWAKQYIIHYWNFTGLPFKDTILNTGTPYNGSAPIRFISNYPIIDMDFYMFDSLGSAGGNELGSTDAQSSGHPEHYTFTIPSDTGTYVVAANLYYNIFRDLAIDTFLMDEAQGPFPITTTFYRHGVLPEIELVQSDVDAFYPNSPDLAVDGADASFKDLFKVIVKPNMYMIYKLNGSLFSDARVIKNYPKNKKSIVIPKIK